MTWPTNPFYGDVTKDANGNYYVYYDNRWYRNVSLSPLTQPTLSVDDIVLADQYSIGLDWSEPRYVKYIKFKTPIGILTFDDEEELTLTKKNHKKIKAKDLHKLGFKKEVELGNSDEKGYHYYTYEISNKCLLISCANDEKINGGYMIEFYEIPGAKIYKLKHLKKLLKILKAISKNE